MGLIHGSYDPTADDFIHGGGPAQLHEWTRPRCCYASNAALARHRIANTMAFMFECRIPYASRRRRNRMFRSRTCRSVCLARFLILDLTVLAEAGQLNLKPKIFR